MKDVKKIKIEVDKKQVYEWSDWNGQGEHIEDQDAPFLSTEIEINSLGENFDIYEFANTAILEHIRKNFRENIIDEDMLCIPSDELMFSVIEDKKVEVSGENPDGEESFLCDYILKIYFDENLLNETDLIKVFPKAVY